MDGCGNKDGADNIAREAEETDRELGKFFSRLGRCGFCASRIMFCFSVVRKFID